MTRLLFTESCHYELVNYESTTYTQCALVNPRLQVNCGKVFPPRNFVISRTNMLKNVNPPYYEVSPKPPEDEMKSVLRHQL
ncbi:hypothetical protein TSAR_002620 [Trichomalopsis sarcophagae]|uniref:Uncharacterized protein n=1 Tax=Trichomalopsis sarcophagae TaxID=543379 RepID=A0A232F3Y0_9HYME|nr:hypothetical protein TSAR_002620 [Trichomalopsis sarcophagae]